MNNSNYSELTLCMKEIITNGNYIGITTILSKIIRSFLESLTKNEQEIRQSLTAEY
jgi:hypothetical protein